jgi:hypothetical protein
LFPVFHIIAVLTSTAIHGDVVAMNVMVYPVHYLVIISRVFSLITNKGQKQT